VGKKRVFLEILEIFTERALKMQFTEYFRECILLVLVMGTNKSMEANNLELSASA
jgi:hypothetical protein